MKKYDLIVADNPWKYDNMQQNDPKRGGITYRTLTMQELYDIPLYKAAKDDSILVSWVTYPKLLDSIYEFPNPLAIIKQWGFRPVTALFIWIKTNKRGQLIEEDTNLLEYDDWYSGLGRYSNTNAEMAILARRGKALPRIDRTVKQHIFAPIGGHSEKPQEQYRRLSRLFGDDIDRLEIFARKQNPPPSNWDATGLDFDGMDIREWIKQYD